MKRFAGPLMILGCTLIWGSAFVAQKTGVDHFGPFTLTCYRNILAGFFLLASVGVRNRLTPTPADPTRRGFSRTACLGGIISGVVLFAAMVTQQLGIEHTTPGISAFLTANYILLVPFLSWLIGRGRPSRGVWLGVGLALAGTYLICLPSVGTAKGLKIGPGEAWTILCAVLFAVQILVVDRCVPRCDVLAFSAVQTFTAAVCAAPFLLLPSELARLSLSHLAAGWFSLFYVAIMSSGIAYTLQNLGQARTPAALAAIVMSFESVVGAVSGYLFLGDVLTSSQLLGCGLVFSAILLSQLIPHNS